MGDLQEVVPSLGYPGAIGLAVRLLGEATDRGCWSFLLLLVRLERGIEIFSLSRPAGRG